MIVDMGTGMDSEPDTVNMIVDILGNSNQIAMLIDIDTY